jgi:hypothetical protein
MSDSNLTRVANRERIEANRRAFESTITAYRETAFLHPVQAARWDNSANQTRSLGPRVVEFCADVELAIAAALKDAPELEGTIKAIVEEQATNPKLEFKVEQACGKVFAARQLQPFKYFAPPIRRGQRDERRGKTA